MLQVLRCSWGQNITQGLGWASSKACTVRRDLQVRPLRALRDVEGMFRDLSGSHLCSFFMETPYFHATTAFPLLS